jgi:capsule polysaccharide export protein KpsE/RkpR
MFTMPEKLTPSREAPMVITGEKRFGALDEMSRTPGRAAAKLRLLWNERRWIGQMTLAALALSLLVAFLIPKRYESTTLLMPPDQQSESGLAMMAVLGKLGGGGGLGGDLLGLKTSGDLFLGVLRSRTVEDAVITKFDLRKEYGDRKWEDARKDLARRTDIFNDRKNGIITITVTDGSPERAAGIAGEYVTQLNTLMTHLNTSSAHRERVFLEERLAQVQNDLENSEKDFSDFASKNTALDVQSQGKAMIEAAATLGGELIASETELQGLRQIYSDNNVRVRALQARVDELRSQELKLTGKEHGAADGDAQAGTSSFPSLRKLPVLGVQFADLTRRVKVQQVIFETLTQEYELAKVQEAKEIPSVKILDQPNIPETKSFPPRARIAVMGVFSGMFLAMGWVLGVKRWKEIDSQSPTKTLAQEVLATLRAGLPLRLLNGSGLRDGRQALAGEAEIAEDEKRDPR